MNHLVQQVKSSLVTHMPGMLTGIGIASFGSAIIISVTATPKALMLLDEKKEELGKEELEPLEILRTTWKCYIPVAVMFGIGTGCAVAAIKVSERRCAAWTTAYSLSETAFREYQDKMVEKLGERKEKQARDEIAQEKVDELQPRNVDVIQTGRGTTICVDLSTQRTFTVDIDDIQSAEDYVKDVIKNKEGYCSWSELYYQLGVCNTEMSEENGWNKQHPLNKIVKSSVLGPDGTPMLAITYDPLPIPEYWRVDRY